MVWDINVGYLPVHQRASIDAFYARSALHIDDDTMMKVASHIDKMLVPDGIVLIEGKGPNDEKIARSHKKGNGTAVDHEEDGHIRRIWTSEFARQMCDKFGWNVVHLTDVQEEWQGVPATFMCLVARKAQ